MRMGLGAAREGGGEGRLWLGLLLLLLLLLWRPPAPPYHVSDVVCPLGHLPRPEEHDKHDKHGRRGVRHRGKLLLCPCVFIDRSVSEPPAPHEGPRQPESQQHQEQHDRAALAKADAAHSVQLACQHRAEPVLAQPLLLCCSCWSVPLVWPQIRKAQPQEGQKEVQYTGGQREAHPRREVDGVCGAVLVVQQPQQHHIGRRARER
mmetsp:Transcript_45547/g.113115  ORF Transcript_45547/g.113115 Transcript_45547/m.113115 type:complete len:205 (-) Transcript_45547:135-749(-)